MKRARYFLLAALAVFVWAGVAADLDARDAAVAAASHMHPVGF